MFTSMILFAHVMAAGCTTYPCTVFNCPSFDTNTGIEYEGSDPDANTAAQISDDACTAAQPTYDPTNPTPNSCVDLDCTEVTVTHE